MSLSSRIKSISYLKAPAAEIVHTVADSQELLIITQNGEAKVAITGTSTATSGCTRLSASHLRPSEGNPKGATGDS